MFDFVGVLVLVVLVALFGFLAVRAWGSKRAWLKWVGLVLSGLLTLIPLLLLVLALVGFAKLNATQPNPVSNLKAGGTPEQVASMGRKANLCSGCHSTQARLPLDGYKEGFFSGPDAPPFGMVQPPNLTPGGSIKDWTDGEVIRAIREGVHKSGRALIVMPADIFRNMSDTDVQALVAYLRSQPAVNHPTASTNLSVVAAIMVATGMAPLQTNQPPITKPIVAPPAAVNAEYGNYLVSIMGCQACHGIDLAGGTPNPQGIPIGPNLTAIVPKYSEADFLKALKTGVTPQGKLLDAEQMPWKEYALAFTDDEMKAIFSYMKGLKLIDKSVK